jgi:hypothetical protein
VEEIKPTHDDTLHNLRECFQFNQDLMEAEFNRAHKKLVEDGFPDDEYHRDMLWDYIWSTNSDEDPFMFSEFIDKDFVRQYRLKCKK